MSSTKRSQPQHVLLVEDNPANRALAKMILEGEGHSVVEATNGLGALSKLAQETFNTIFMDIQMPKMDGLVTTKIIRIIEKNGELREDLDVALIEGLKKMLAGKHHPIIALTAHAMSGDRKKCMAAGVDAYLTKPFRSEEIVVVLNDIEKQVNLQVRLTPRNLEQ